VEESKPFAVSFVGQGIDTRDIPARPIEARNQTYRDRVER
jgi:hypothetical protein